MQRIIKLNDNAGSQEVIEFCEELDILETTMSDDEADKTMSSMIAVFGVDAVKNTITRIPQ